MAVEAENPGKPVKAKDERTMEVEAESVSYAVCQYFGIETGENSFGYIATWSSGRELPELKASLDTISKTANTLITSIDRNFREICKERGIDLAAQPEQAEPDTQEKFVSDLFDYLHELHKAGFIQDPGGAEIEEHYLRQLTMGEFNGLRSVLSDTEETVGTPAIVALRDRLEKLSDQWDAGLVCKVEPPYDFGRGSDKYAVQTYSRQDGQLFPGDVVFLGTQRQCQNIILGLEAGTFTLRQVRQPDFEPPEPEYVYKMEMGADDQHVVQAYVKTEQQTLIPGPVLFAGSSDVCAGLTERLNAGTLTQDDFFTVSAARASCYTTKDGVELDALVGPDKKVYLGRRDHYDNRGHYLDDDKSLIHISDTYRVFDVISGSSAPYTYDELWETRFFSDKEFSNFIALQLEEPQANAALLDTVLDEYPMPDPNISADALSMDCNYIDGDLLPLSKDRAMELLERDLTVYMVQFGENPSMVFDSEELLEYSPETIFAVPREEWEASPDFHQAIVDRLNHQEERERAFLDHGGDCFAIYQLKDGEEQRDLRFMNMDWLNSKGLTPDRANYDLAYTGEMAYGQGSSALERLYQKFNTRHPADYHRPSVSVSDILAVKQDGVVSFHYCDSYGYAKVPDFIKPENYLKNAEMAMEDDYGMIDGIINNGPKQQTVAELEQQARSGQPISLMELAAASHREEREKKQSVREKLKNQPKQERKRTAPKKSAERER